jgi:secreted trypsin-like serine protease
MYMYRKITIITSIAMLMMLLVTPAGAITYGEPDGNRHPNVGLTLTDLSGDGTLWLGCSGTLISPTVFLTAGHCTHFLAQLGPENSWITFDPEYSPDSSKLVSIAGFATHPGMNFHTYFNDVGVIILAEPVSNVTPAILASENLLDEMKAAGALQDQTFVTVGYGATADFKGHPPILARDGVRRISTSPYSGLTQNWLHLLGNHDATGQGGSCFGDSGAPRFLGNSNLIVSITTWGDTNCRSLNMGQRVDTPEVRIFLGNYVTLP